MSEKGALPKDKKSSITPAAESTPRDIQPPEIKKGTSEILEPKYAKMHVCAYDKCPITKKQILFGMHCVFFENKTYHALCANQVPIVFKIQQPPQRSKEASN